SGFTSLPAGRTANVEVPESRDRIQQYARQVLDARIRDAGDETLQRDTQTGDAHGHQRKSNTQDRTSEDHPTQPGQDRRHDRGGFER
ncbi:hypothetical protein, partial [Macrococcoides caseolyticum]